jgi:hypothetical protein
MSFWGWFRLGEAAVLALLVLAVWRLTSGQEGLWWELPAAGATALTGVLAVALHRYQRRRQRQLELGRRIVRMPDARRRGTR